MPTVYKDGSTAHELRVVAAHRLPSATFLAFLDLLLADTGSCRTLWMSLLQMAIQSV